MIAVILFVVFWIAFCSALIALLFKVEKLHESEWGKGWSDPLDPSDSTDLI